MSRPRTDSSPGSGPSHRFHPYSSSPASTRVRREDSAVAIPEVDQDEYAGWFLRVYNLDSCTRDSAERHARRIIAALPPLPTVPLDRLIYFSPETPTRHNLTRISVRLPSAGYLDGAIAEGALYALRDAIISAGHECAIASSSGNDLHTLLNYTIRPSDRILAHDWTEGQTKQRSASQLNEVFARLRCTLVALWDWSLHEDPIEVRGACAELSPRRCIELVSKLPHVLDSGDVLDFQYPYTYVAIAFATLALWTNGAPSKVDEYKQLFIAAAEEYRWCHGHSATVQNVRLTHDGQFVLVDPDTQGLARFLCRTTIKGSFPRLLYSLNAPRSNFARKNLVAYQEDRLIKRAEADDAECTRECGTRGRLVETWRPPPRWERWLDRQRHLGDGALRAAAVPSRFNPPYEPLAGVDPDEDENRRPTPLAGDPPAGRRKVNPLLGSADQSAMPVKTRCNSLRVVASEQDLVLPRRPRETLSTLSKSQDAARLLLFAKGWTLLQWHENEPCGDERPSERHYLRRFLMAMGWAEKVDG